METGSWLVGAASLISTCYTAFWNRRYTRQLLPGITVRRQDFRWKKVWELISLGAWNSLTRLGQQLLDGVDILLSGALILDESASMTMLSLAKNGTYSYLQPDGHGSGCLQSPDYHRIRRR